MSDNHYKLGLFLAIFWLGLGGFTQAFAGEVAPSDAWSLTVGGEMELDTVWRSQLADEVLHARNRAAGRTDHFTDYEVTLDLLFDLGHQTTFFLQLENNHRESRGEALHDIYELVLDMQQAYIRLEDFLLDRLDWTLGLQDVTYDFLADGNPMMFEVSEAIDPNVFGGLKVAYRSELSRLEFVYGMLEEARLAGPNIPLDYEQRDLIILHWENYSESGHWARFLELSSIGLSDSERVYTLGGGFDYWPTPDIRLYAEGYLQRGKVPIAAGAVDQRSHALRAGLRLQKHSHPRQPYIDFSAWSFGGSDESPGTRDGNFVSLGDVDSTIVMEENDYGLGLRSNYQALKVQVGFDIRKFHRLDAVAAWFRRDDTDFDSTLGLELDLWYTRQFSSNVDLRYGMGYLFNADHFKDALGAHSRAAIFRMEMTLKF